MIARRRFFPQWPFTPLLGAGSAIAWSAMASAAEPPKPLQRLVSPIVIDAAAPAPTGCVSLTVHEAQLLTVSALAGEGVVLLDVPWAPGETQDLIMRSVKCDPTLAIEVVRTSELETQYSDLFTDDMMDDAAGLILVGQVLGAPDSKVILSFGPAGVFGILDGEGGRRLISSGPYGAGHPLLAFDPAQVSPSLLKTLEWTCDADDILDGSPMEGGLAEEPPCRQFRIAADTDFEYLQLFQGSEIAAANYAMLLVAAAGEIFTAGPNARLGLTYLRLWSTTSDPWDATTPYLQLVQFRAHWNTLMLLVPRDAAHFLSGRELGGGSAWTATVCGTNAFSLSSNLLGSFPYPLVDHDPQNWDVLVVTHEIGHNLGAKHTHQHGIDSPDSCFFGDCTAAWGGTIMSYCYLCPGGMANIVLSFAEVSVNDILGKLESVACEYSAPGAIPVAVVDWAEVEMGSSVSIAVIANDETVNCGAVALAGFDAMTLLGGVVSFDAETGVLAYQSPSMTLGVDAFAYTLIGEGLAIGVGQVQVGINTTPADLDGNGHVDGSDLGVMLGAWGSNDIAADLDDDGLVTGNDVGVLLGAWTG